MQEFEVVIVGLGPVGAVAANLAGAAGLRTLVVEKSEEPYIKPRAIVFDAEIMRIFNSIDLAVPIATVTKPLGGSVYLGADRQPIRTFRAPLPQHQAWHASNLFYQPQLEGILRDGIARYPNVEVRQGHELLSIVQSVSGATLNLKTVGGAETIEVRGDFVLACDGASSTVRKALGISLDDIGFEERWLVVDTFVDGPMRWPSGYGIPTEVRDGRYSLMVCEPARPATLIPGVGRHRRWEYMLLPGEHPDDIVPDDWLRAQLAQWIDPDDVEIVRSAVYRFRALVASHWRAGNVFLLGDAAHQTPPFFGQGMCHGIRDAAQLMWKLRLVRDGVASSAILDSYQVEREPHVREIIAASVSAGAAVCKLDPDEARVRDIAFRAQEAAREGRPAAMTDVVPPIRNGVVETATGGMRVPDFAFTAADGSTRRLDDLLAGRFGLLCLDAEDVPPAIARFEITIIAISSSAGSALSDCDGALSAWMKACGARFALIRPDRYVHSTASERAELAAGLDLLSIQLGIAAPRLASTEPQSRRAIVS